MALFLKLTFNIILASSCVDPSAGCCIPLPKDVYYTNTFCSNKATHLMKYHYSHSVYGKNWLLTSHSHCKHRKWAPGFSNSHISSLTTQSAFPLISISTLRMAKNKVIYLFHTKPEYSWKDWSLGNWQIYFNFRRCCNFQLYINIWHLSFKKLFINLTKKFIPEYKQPKCD